MTASRQAPLSEAEFAAIERLLADLLVAADTADEERAILTLHSRVRGLFETGAAERQARERLMALRAGQGKCAKISRARTLR